jgi:hypothetical protein
MYSSFGMGGSIPNTKNVRKINKNMTLAKDIFVLILFKRSSNESR